MNAPPPLFFAVSFVWIGLVVAFGIWRRLRSGKPIVPRIPGGAAFGEAGCSGSVVGRFPASMMSANRCLLVYVADGRLVVTLVFPLSLMPMRPLKNLDFDVAISAVARVTPVRRFWQDMIHIDFVDTDRPSIDLTIKDEIGLFAALGQTRPAWPGNTRELKKGNARGGWRRIFTRVFLCIWGCGFLYGSSTQIASDLAIRAHGLQTTGTLVEFSGKNGVVRYRVAATEYMLASSFGEGMWVVGQTETVIYDRDNPARATEKALLPLVCLMVLPGFIALIFGIFGTRVITFWTRST